MRSDRIMAQSPIRRRAVLTGLGALGLWAGFGLQSRLAGTPGRSRVSPTVDWMANRHVPGLAACIVRGDRIVWSGGYGMANLTESIPFTPDRTLFQIASITKVITATAVLQLRDRGLFELDDDVSDYLGFPVRNPRYPGRPITFRHLLTHTSSLDEGEALDNTYAVGDPTVSLEEVVARYFREKGWFWREDRYGEDPPGTEKRYSNAGYALLGYLVEAISRQPLEAYLQENVYGVLKMQETSFYISKLDPERQARPYTYARELEFELCPGHGDGNLLPKGVSPKLGYNEHALYSYPTLADGMVRTSVNQLANFMIAMMNGGRFDGVQLLKEETVDEMLSGDGLCWFRTGDHWWHDGRDPGCETEIVFNPETRSGLIVFANAEADLEQVRALLRAEAEAART
jgi:CubicO group peptidase (beta-lactamase class C family)